ncbi:hypothetical protein [Paenirhodobacter enshiensis]|uniref:hypothetical protein n=1 Tax=Paenirhodobacter enshiensis TaxID=1105367 RepID=UPI0035AEAF7C
MTSGLPTVNFPVAQLLDSVLGNRLGSASQITVAHLAAQIGQLIGTTGGGGAGSAHPALAAYSHAPDDPDTVMLSGGYAALEDGMEVVFVPEETNTGPATINLDGLGALPALTMSGASLPADYLRPYYPTRARYMAYPGAWAVSRDLEDVEDASGGSYTRWESGLQICRITRGSGDPSMTWDFPTAFIALPQVNVTVLSNRSYFATISDQTETSVTICIHNSVDHVAETSIWACAVAIGRWY